jgi:hypothetical protein
MVAKIRLKASFFFYNIGYSTAWEFDVAFHLVGEEGG